MDFSVNIFRILHITYNVLLRTVDIDGLWDRLGSPIQAQNGGQNKSLNPDACLHRPEPLFSYPFIGRTCNITSFFVPSYIWEFLLLQVMDQGSWVHTLAQPENCKLALPVLALGKSKTHVAAVWHKVAGKTTGSCRARLYSTCWYFGWFQQYSHLVAPSAASPGGNYWAMLSTQTSVLVRALFRTHDLLSLLLENLSKYTLTLHVLRFLFNTSIIFYVQKLLQT